MSDERDGYTEEDLEGSQSQARETLKKPNFLKGALMKGALALGISAAAASSGGDINSAVANGELDSRTTTEYTHQIAQGAQEKNQTVEDALSSGKIELNGNWEDYFIPVSPEIAAQLQQGQEGFLFPFDPSRSDKLNLEIESVQNEGNSKKIVKVSNINGMEYIYTPFKGTVSYEDKGDNSIQITLDGVNYNHPRTGKGQAPAPTQEILTVSGTNENLIFLGQDSVSNNSGELGAFQVLGITGSPNSDSSAFSFTVERPNAPYGQKVGNPLTYEGKIAFVKTTAAARVGDPSHIPGPIIFH